MSVNFLQYSIFKSQPMGPIRAFTYSLVFYHVGKVLPYIYILTKKITLNRVLKLLDEYRTHLPQDNNLFLCVFLASFKNIVFSNLRFMFGHKARNFLRNVTHVNFSNPFPNLHNCIINMQISSSLLEIPKKYITQDGCACMGKSLHCLHTIQVFLEVL